MAACKDRQTARLLHAYELGLLNDEDRARVELHVHQCNQCFRELLEMEAAARLIRNDDQVQRSVAELATDNQSERASRSSLLSFWRVMAPVAVTAAIVLFLVLKDWRLEISPQESAVAIENRVAILPFENLTQSAENSDMGDVVANLLITGLSQASSLQIVSSQYIYDLSRQVSQSEDVSRSNTAETVAKRARARWLVDGAITQVASEMVVTAQLIEVPTGTVRSASKVSVNVDKSVFAAIDQLATDMRIALVQPSVRTQEVYQPIAALTTTSSEAYHEYIRGIDLNRKFFYGEARPHFLKAVELDSTFAMPYYYLAVLSTGPESREWLNKALQYVDRASDRDRYFIKGLAARLSGDWKTNLEVLNDFVKRYKDEKEPLLQLGIAEYTYSMLPKAKEHILASLALDSSNGLAWNQLAYTYERLGVHDSAILAVDRYVALTPTEPNPHDSRADIYARCGNLQQAIESCRQALTLKPDFYASLALLGVLSIFNEDFSRADSCFRALADTPNPADRLAAALYRCYIPAYQGRFREALTRIDAVIQADSLAGSTLNLPYRLYWKATILEASGSLPDALSTLDQSLKLNGNLDSTDGNRRKAYRIRLLALLGQSAEALKSAVRLKTELDSGGFYLLPFADGMAAIYLAANHPDSALACLEPQQHEVDIFYDRLMMGKVYLADHRLDNVTAVLKRSVGTYTVGRMFWTAESVKLHYYLGLTLEESKQPMRAAEEYRTFLRIWKNADPGIKEIADAQKRLAAIESELKDSVSAKRP